MIAASIMVTIACVVGGYWGFVLYSARCLLHDTREARTLADALAAESVELSARLRSCSAIVATIPLCYDRDLARVSGDLDRLKQRCESRFPELGKLRAHYRACMKVIARIKAERDIIARLVDRHAGRRESAV